MVAAHRELGFIEVQAGRTKTADAWLQRAQALAETDQELAAVLGVRGQVASDRADYPVAFECLGESVERAARCADQRQQAWSLSILARAHLLRDERSQAAVAVAGSLELTNQQRWIAFLPWPQTLQAELDILAGDLDTAADRLEQAWTLGCQVGDPCWEAMAARGLGRVERAPGRPRRGDRVVRRGVGPGLPGAGPVPVGSRLRAGQRDSGHARRSRAARGPADPGRAVRRRA